MPAKISGYPASEPLAPLKGSVTASVGAEKSQTDATSPNTTAQTGDHVTLTTSARSLQKLSDAIAQSPAVNSSKVASIKQAVDGGSYKVDASRVADKLLQFESGLK